MDLATSRLAHLCTSVIFAFALGALTEIVVFPVHAAQQGEVELNISAQSLASALTEVGSQAKVRVLFDEDLVKGVKAPALKGSLTPEAALNQLLRDSGLIASSSGLGTFIVQRAKQTSAQEPSQDPAITLPQVTVQDVREQGYAASRSTTATKIDAPIMDIPQSIQVVPRQVIEDQRAVTLSDVLRNVSGFSPSVNSQSQRFGERDAIFRGFTSNNYYTNGFKDSFNGSSFTAGLANVERVEVLKGPASVLYGLGDPSGTVNIITKQPLSEWYASGSLTGARFALVNPSTDVSGPITPGKELRFRFNAGYQYQDSFVDYVK